MMKKRKHLIIAQEMLTVIQAVPVTYLVSGEDMGVGHKQESLQMKTSHGQFSNLDVLITSFPATASQLNGLLSAVPTAGQGTDQGSWAGGS